MLSKLFKRFGKQDDAPAGKSFLAHYDSTFAPHLGVRAGGFRAIFELLEQRAQSAGRPMLIVDTGGMRKFGNWADDGQSSYQWGEFAGMYDCEVHTVDPDPQAAQVVRAHCRPEVQAHSGDSVDFLYQMARKNGGRQIDLLYLDSFDFDAENPFPSAMHHVKELIAARPCLHKGSIVAIDDNLYLADGGMTGRGYLAMQWFEHLNIAPVHRGHQLVWQL